MSVTANLNNDKESVITGNDSIIVIHIEHTLRGGRTLDMTGYGPALTGNIATLGAITGGSSYVNGTYTNVPLTGGTGTKATADIVVAGGAVTSVTIKSGGSGYTVADSLSASNANLGGAGSGFAVPVATIQAKDAEDVVREGHVIIKETATGNFKPMPIIGGAQYDSLPSGHTYQGILGATIQVKKPFASVVVDGVVNDQAAYYSMTAIKSAFVAAVPHIKFIAD